MPLKWNPSPSTLLRLGMLFLILFAISMRPLQLQAYVGEQWSDGIRGFLIALSGGFNILSIIKRRNGAMSCPRS
jgi:hypothetical protein